MKKLKVMLIYVFIIILLSTINVYAASNPYPQYFKDQTNCTWYAWKMAYEKGGVALPVWGNANTWYESAKNAGYQVGTEPQANSIAIWTKCDGDCATYGHVGYVERVSQDGKTLYIKDTSYGGMNGCPNTEDETYKECIRNGVSEETDRICLENAPRVTCGFAKDINSQGFYTGDITQFIYLNNAPKIPVVETNPDTTNTNTNTNQTQTEKPQTEIKKSNNTNLKEVNIKNLEMEFSNDVTEYNFDVENNVSLIEITAILEDEKSTLEGIGEHSLEVGNNHIELTVTAEDNTKKTYKLNINRKEKLEEDKLISTLETPKAENKEQDNNKKNNTIFLTVIASIIILTLIIVSFIIKKKIKKN